MKRTMKRLMSMLLTLAMVLGLLPGMPLTVLAAGNTIYIVDDGDPRLTSDPAHNFMWSQMTTAVTALTEGDTLDMSGVTATPATLKNIILSDKAVTVIGNSGIIYPLSISTNNNLSIVNYKSLVEVGQYALNFTANAELNVTGNCIVETTESDEHGISFNSNLTISGTGMITARGKYSGILLYNLTNSQTLTINTTVVAESTTPIMANTGGLRCDTPSATINGSGSLTAIGAAGTNTNGLYFSNQSATNNVTFSELSSLTLTGSGNGHGIYFSNMTNSHNLTFNLPNATYITGGAGGSGLFTYGAATGAVTVINNGAAVSFVSGTGAATNFGIRAETSLTLGGMGDILATGYYYGINMNGSNSTLTIKDSVNVTAESTGIYTDNTALKTTTGAVLDITGNGDVTFQGSNAGNGNGIFTQSNLAIKKSGTGAFNVLGGGTGSGVRMDGSTRPTLDLTGMNEDFIPTGGSGEVTAEGQSSGIIFYTSPTIKLGSHNLIAKGGIQGGAGFYSYLAGTGIAITSTGGKLIAEGGNGTYGYGLRLEGSFMPFTDASEVVLELKGGTGAEGLRVYGGIGLTLSGKVNVTAEGGTGAKGTYFEYFNTNKGVKLTDADQKITVKNNSTSVETIPFAQPGTLPWRVAGDGAISAGNGMATDMRVSIPTNTGTAKAATLSLDSTLPAITAPNAGALTAGAFGAAYSVTLTTAASSPTWAVVSGALPAGLTLNASTGEISGTPTAGGTFNFVVAVTSGGKTSAPLAYSITVSVTDAQKVAADKDALTFDTIKDTNTAPDSITANLTLPPTGTYGSDIAWVSSDTTTITNTGAVTRPLTGTKTVTLTATISFGAATPATKEFILTVTSSDTTNLSGVYLTNATQPNVSYLNIGAELVITAYGEPGATVKADVTYNDVLDNDTAKTLSDLVLTETAGTGIYKYNLTIADGMIVTGVKTTMTSTGRNPAELSVPTAKIPETRGTLVVTITNGASTEGLVSLHSASLASGNTVKAANVGTISVKSLQGASDYKLSMLASDGFDMGTLSNIAIIAGKINTASYTATLPTTLKVRLLDGTSGDPLPHVTVTVRDKTTGRILASSYSDIDGYTALLGASYKLAAGQQLELVVFSNQTNYSIGGASVSRDYPAQTAMTYTLSAGVNTVDMTVSEINKSAAVAGAVTDQNSDPVTGATVSVTQIVGGKIFTWSAVTGADGSFSVPVVPGVSANVQCTSVIKARQVVSASKTVTAASAGDTATADLSITYYNTAEISLTLFTQEVGESGWNRQLLDGYSLSRKFKITAVNESAPQSITAAPSNEVLSIAALPGDVIRIKFDGRNSYLGTYETTCTVGADLKVAVEMRVKQPGSIIKFRLFDKSGKNLTQDIYRFKTSSDVRDVHDASGFRCFLNPHSSIPISYRFLPSEDEYCRIWVEKEGTHRLYIETKSSWGEGTNIIHLTSWPDELAERDITVSNGEILIYGDIHMTTTAYGKGASGQVSAVPAVSAPGGMVTLKTNYYGNYGYLTTSLSLQVPAGTTFVPGSLTLNNKVLSNPTIGSSDIFEVQIPTGEQSSGNAAFRVTINSDIDNNRIFSSAVSGNYYLGSAEIQIQTLSLDAPEYTAQRDMTIRGKAPAGATVTIRDRGVVIGSAVASETGTWYMNVLLPGEDGVRYLHELVAEAAYNGETHVTALRSMWYEPNYPKLTSILAAGKVLDVSGGSVAFPYSYNPAHGSNVKLGATFSDNSAVSNVTFYVQSGGYTSSAVGTYNAQKDIYEATVIDGLAGAAAGAASGDIWVEYEADLSYLFSGEALTEDQLRTQLPSSYGNFEVREVSDVQILNPADYGIPDYLAGGNHSGKTIKIDNFPNSTTSEFTFVNVDLTGWSSVGKTPLYSDSRHNIYEEYCQITEVNGKETLSFFYVIEDKATPFAGRTALRAAGGGFGGFGGSGANDFAGEGGASDSALTEFKEEQDVWNKVEATRQNIENSCASDEMKQGWLNMLDMAVKQYMKAKSVGAGLAALSLLPGGGLAGAAGAGMRTAAKKNLLNRLKSIDKSVDDYDSWWCERKCDPNHPAYDPNNCKDPDPDPKKPGAGPDWIRDPSGIVYEVTLDNPLQGVTATLLKETSPDVWEVWDAEWYEQLNPQITESDGWYAWDVPNGNWMVMYSKDGYKTEYSPAMEVPPIRLDVHQALESLSAPIVEGVYTTNLPDAIDIVFDKYMDIADINLSNISVYTALLADDGTPLVGNEFLTGPFTAVGAVDYKGQQVAKTFRFTLSTGAFDAEKAYSVSFMPVIRSYAGVPLGTDGSGNNITGTVTAPPPVPVKGIAMDTMRHYLKVGDAPVQAVPTVSPLNAANQSVSWTTSDASVATVNSSGYITPVGVGACAITAETNDGGFEAYANVYVSAATPPVGDIPVTGVTLDKSDISLTVGGSSVKLNATVSPADASNKAVTWSVCNTSIVTVDQSGNVTPVGVGTCVVTVASQENPNLKAECIVRVTQGSTNPGGNPGGSTGGTDTNRYITVNGVNIPVTITNGIVTVKLTKELADQLIAASVDGNIVFNFCALDGVTGVTGFVFEADPSWFIGAKINSLKLNHIDIGSVKFNANMLKKLAKLYKLLTFKVNKGSLVFDILSDGKSIGWYDYEDPILVSLPVSGADFVMKNIPRSWVKDNTLYGFAYSTGRYEAVAGKPINFTDTAGKWMNPAAQYMSARGVIAGIGNNQFAPEKNVTRAEFVTMLMNALNIEPQGNWKNTTQQFSDVAQGKWYYDVVLRARALGIIAGVGNNRFTPDATVTRQDMFLMLYNAMTKCGLILPVTDAEEPKQFDPFKDSGDLSAYAKKSMATFIREGMVSGKGNGILDPKGTATRAEAAQIIYNMLLRDVKKQEQ